MTAIEKIRNIAIIAHVDHGKTTLVDAMFKGAHMFRDNQRVQERAMDSNDQERERGITILAKTTALHWGGYRFNIVDTPGHADFGGEVERVLSMVDSVLLVVDAFDGPMPQTKFVTRKALALGLRPIVVINKVDRPGARPLWAQDAVFDLLIELGATDAQLDFCCVFASAKQGYAMMDINDPSESLDPLFDAIVKHCPSPNGDPEAPLQMLVTLMDYNDFVGQIGIGRIVNGQIKVNDPVALIKRDGTIQTQKVTMLYGFEGLTRVNLAQASAGEIIALAGIPDIRVGETIASLDDPQALEYVEIDEPTISMMFVVNNGPFAGQDGKYTQSRRIRERLMKELQFNVALRVEDTDSPDSFKVSGRGELHLSVLIETMRRERLRAVREPARGDPAHRPRDRREDGALRGPLHRRARSVHGHRHGEAGRAQGGDAGHGPGAGPGAPALQDPQPRPDRLPLRVHDRHPGRGHHPQPVQPLRPLQGRTAPAQERRAGLHGRTATPWASP